MAFHPAEKTVEGRSRKKEKVMTENPFEHRELYTDSENPAENNGRKRRYLSGLICAAAVLITAAGLLFSLRYLLNERFLSDYGNGIYSDRYERPLLMPNIPEGWLPLYHMGNICYQNGDYDSAVNWYQQSLEKKPPAEEKECSVRINLALALLRKIDYESFDTEEGVRVAVRQLETARAVLTEHGCADPEGTDGHSAEAEKLKEEIDKLLEQLQNPDGSDGREEKEQEQQDRNEQEQKQDDRQESGREKHIREELERQRQKSARERAEAGQEKIRREEGDQAGEFDGKTW